MAEATGNAGAQSDLWGAHARDWADVMEGWNGWGVPVYRHILERLTVEAGTRVLDVGCGAGRFSRIAADRGAEVCGLDATEALLEIARERVLDGDFRSGEMEELPWGDDEFDVVTGFNSFFLASDMVRALKEARRVARPGAGVATTVFGRPDRCQSTAIFATLPELMGAPKPSGDEPDEDPGPQLHDEGVLEERATEAGLEPRETDYFAFAEQYADLETLLRGFMSAAPFVRAAGVAGEDKVREALTEVAGPFKQADGRYRLEEEARYLVASA